MSRSKSPFERWDLDPHLSLADITERLRELAEDADPELAEEIRAAWRELTLHPDGRFEAALDARPETRVPVGPPPRFVKIDIVEAPLELSDLLPKPRLRNRDGLT